MFLCDEIVHECNEYREPCSRRGSDVTVSSVTGTGPGAACPKPSEPSPEPRTLPKRVCKISVLSNGKINYKTNKGIITSKVC